MKRLLLFMMLILISYTTSFSQVTTLPLNPTDSEAITITFDSTGTELEGYTGDIYAFTGATVNGVRFSNLIGDWGDNSLNPLLTRDVTNPNLYEILITPSIFEYYDISITDNVSELVFIFRSSDAGLKSQPDYFIPIVATNPLPIPENMGVVGSATPNGWGGPDIPMNFNESTNTFEVTTYLGSGEIKFRTNNDWSVNYGDDELDGILDNGGGNIPVNEGDYFISFSIDTFEYSIQSAYVNIPDSNFEQSLIDIGIDSNNTINGQILRSEAEAVTDLNLTNPLFDSSGFENPLITTVTGKISDLTGIEAFKKITNLQLGNGDLTTIDISNNKLLQSLFLNDNQLTAIDISKNTLLRRFGVMRNPIVETVDVSNNPLLEELFLFETNIDNLNVSQNPNLWKLYIYNTNVTGLNLSSNSNFTHLRAQNNPSLSYLNMRNGNNSNVSWFSVNNTPMLTCVTADDLVSNAMTTYSEDPFSDDCGTVYIPDSNFEQALIDLGIDASGVLDGVILKSEAELVTILDVSDPENNINLPNVNGKIQDLTGIEAFLNILELFVYKNLLTNIDISNNTELTKLHLSENQLTNLDLTNNTRLLSLSIDNNQLTTLDISININLDFLGCHNNPISSLDVTKNINLGGLSLGDTLIEEIDLSNNVLLRRLWADNSNFLKLDLSKNPELIQLNLRNNKLTSLNLSHNVNLLFPLLSNSLNLKHLDLRNGNNINMSYVEFINTPELTCINADATISQSMINSGKNFSEDCGDFVYIPDANFEQALIDLGIDSDGVVNTSILREDAENTLEINVSFPTRLNLQGVEIKNWGADPRVTITERIKDLTGVEAFVNITKLDCGYNEISTIDLMNNIALLDLDVKNNALNTLEVSHNIILDRLDCRFNQLTSLDITMNTNLTNLLCQNNQISSLDVLNNLDITILNFSFNKISSIDVSNNLSLTYLNCIDNQLTSLDVSSNVSLSNLYCSSNQISNLNLVNNPNLKILSISDLPIASVDLTSNKELIKIFASENPNMANIDLSQKTKLNQVTITNSILKTLDLSNNPDLKWLRLYDNPDLEHLDVRNNSNGNILRFDIWNTPILTCINADSVISQKMIDSGKTFSKDCGDFVYIPDANFEQALIDLGIDSDGVINTSILRIDAEAVTELNLNVESLASPHPYGEGTGNPLITNVTETITDLTGIEAFVNLIQFSCGYHALTEVDLSNNSLLTKLELANNVLTSINITNLLDLDWLNVIQNQITGIDISNNTELRILWVETNSLSNIDITANTKLENLAVGFNSLTSIDVSNNFELGVITAEGNNLTTINVSNNSELVALWLYNNADFMKVDLSKNTLLNTLAIWNTKIETIDLSNNPAFRRLFAANSSQLKHVDMRNGNNINVTSFNVSNTHNLLCVNADDNVSQSMINSGKNFSEDCGDFVYIPDPHFEQSLIDIGIDSDGVVNTSILREDAESVTSLNLNNDLFTPDGYFFNNPLITNVTGKIADLTGIEAFINITNLQVSYSDLLIVNVSNNTLLEELWVTDGQLMGIDVTNNTNLIKLGVFINNISGTIDVSQNIALEWLFVSNNPITSLDVTKNIALWNLWLPGTQITSLDISANLNLQRLEAQYNPGLNLITNPAGYPALTGLNLSGIGLTNYNLYAPLFPNVQWLLLNDNNLDKFNGNNTLQVSNLFLNNNQIESLNLSVNSNLVQLNATNNVLTELDLRNGNNINLTTVDVSNNSLTCISVDDPTDVGIPYASWVIDSGVIYSANCKGEPEVVRIPDSNFEEALFNLGFDTNGLNGNILLSDAESIVSLDVNSSGINDLTGVESFVSLTELNVSYNQLNVINLIENTNLSQLNISGNNLSELQLFTSRIMTDLDASSNQITSLNLSDFDKLTTVNLSNNNLLEFNIQNGNNFNITFFDVQNNTNLNCIGVDDENNIPPNWYKGSTTIYSSTGDCVAPIVFTKDISIELDRYGLANISGDDINNGSYDNVTSSGKLILDIDKAVFNCADLGDNTVQLTVTDESGNSDFAQATVTVVDNILPEANSLRSITFDLVDETNEILNLIPADIDDGSSDNCGQPILSIDQDTFTNPGIYTVVLTAMDSDGNSSTSETTVEVVNSNISGEELKFGGTTLTVYPVPFSNIINISFSKPTDLTTVNVELLYFDTTSTGIQFYNNGVYMFSDDTSGLTQANGTIYWLQVTIGRTTKTVQIIKG